MTLSKDDEDFAFFNSLLRLDEETGKLYWKVKGHGRSLTKPAGSSHRVTGYVTIQIKRKRYRAHNIVWLLVTGNWPEYEIDHINHRTFDNRPENLRDVTKSLNNYNRQTANQYDCPGIFQVKSGKYRAMLGRDLLGFFDTVEEAISTRRLAQFSI